MLKSVLAVSPAGLIFWRTALGNDSVHRSDSVHRHASVDNIDE